jgi:nucleolar protein 56
VAETQDLRKKLMQLTKKNMKESYSSNEVHIIRTTHLIESIDEVNNLLTEQLREWHAVHFPELNQLVKSNDSFIELIAKLTSRNKFDAVNVHSVIQDTVLAEKIISKAKDSSGENTDKNTLNEMKSLAEKILELKQEKKQLTELIEKIMKEKWPNVTEITGAILGAKMISKIGSAKKFAFAPSSTIQLIGAEKALFLHLKKGNRSPKYGFLYIHPKVIKAKRNEKGKIARQMAGKISIAAKKDYFAKKD